MRLTLHTDYALRVLIYAGLNAGRLITIEDVARAYLISKEHLRKVVHQLGRHGYLATVQGRRGGLRLNATPERIRVGDVVRRMEPDFCLVECMTRKSECRIYDACALRPAFDKARDAFLAVLDDYRLSDLLKPKGELQHFLGMV